MVTVFARQVSLMQFFTHIILLQLSYFNIRRSSHQIAQFHREYITKLPSQQTQPNSPFSPNKTNKAVSPRARQRKDSQTPPQNINFPDTVVLERKAQLINRRRLQRTSSADVDLYIRFYCFRVFGWLTYIRTQSRRCRFLRSGNGMRRFQWDESFQGDVRS